MAASFSNVPQELLNVFLALKMSPTVNQMSRVMDEGRNEVYDSVRDSFAYLQTVVDEIHWSDKEGWSSTFGKDFALLCVCVCVDEAI